MVKVSGVASYWFVTFTSPVSKAPGNFLPTSNSTTIHLRVPEGAFAVYKFRLSVRVVWLPGATSAVQ